ncbi:hypothetical protein ACVDG8_007850 [Mesorhizobium sp. ORM8.1]
MDEFFRILDGNNVVFLHQDITQNGATSRSTNSSSVFDASRARL